MDYFDVVKKAFIFPWKYRFLFWLGILAAFTSTGGGNGFNFSGNAADFQNLFNNQNDKSSTFLDPIKNIAPRVLGASTNKFQDWLSAHSFGVGLVILFLILVIITLWVFGIFARVGIIRSVPKLEKGGLSNFSQALWDGKRFFWRLIAVGILLFLFFLLLLGVLIGIAIPFFLISFIVGLIWLIPAIIIFIIAAVYVDIVTKFWMRHIIVEDKGVIKTLVPAVKFVNHKFKEAIIFWLINIVINLVMMFVSFVILMIIGLPLGFLALGVGAVNLIAGIILGGITLIILGLVMLAVSGYYTAVINSYWTLAYLEIKKFGEIPQGSK